MSNLVFSNFEILASACFFVALLHTFSVKQFQGLAMRFPKGTAAENFFHLLGEVEVVFGLWAGLFILLAALFIDKTESLNYLNSRNFTEPVFVFVIMVVCSTRPILELVDSLIFLFAKLIPFKKNSSIYISSLVVGPLLGSFITEPAAMTVTALFLFNSFFKQAISERSKYLTLGLLFVNISIGGTLTPYAAPPILMVASKWGWDFKFIFLHFAWRAILAILVSTLLTVFLIQKDINKLSTIDLVSKKKKLPLWVTGFHLLFLLMIISSHHNMVIFIGLFLFFLGLVTVTKHHQQNIKLKESLLVGFFLGGLVVLGGTQKWWLQPAIENLSSISLYFGSIVLTSFTDNAALTYLGSQVENISELAKISLVAGSVVGGGLTVIANAPNPAGYSILNSCFGTEGISPLRLFLGAILPTLITAVIFFPF